MASKAADDDQATKYHSHNLMPAPPWVFLQIHGTDGRPKIAIHSLPTSACEEQLPRGRGPAYRSLREQPFLAIASTADQISGC